MKIHIFYRHYNVSGTDNRSRPKGFDFEKCFVNLLNTIQNKNIEFLVEECINRYFRCYLDLINRGYKVIIWGGHPSTTSGHNDDENSPVYGDCQHRNAITLYWNNYFKNCYIEGTTDFIFGTTDFL